jgi:hypothetical protein
VKRMRHHDLWAERSSLGLIVGRLSAGDLQTLCKVTRDFYFISPQILFAARPVT